MALLPAGVVPPLPYLLALLVGVAAVGYTLVRRGPVIGERTVVALAPWMAVGSSLHVLYALDVLPPVLAPFAGTGAVYGTVAVAAGVTWLAALETGRDVPRTLAAVGVLAVLPVVGVALATGLARGTTQFLWPGIGLVVAVAVGGLAWWLLNRVRPAVAVTGWVGALAVFGHALDGVSTAVGVDVLAGFGERTPLSRLILEFSASLPTADLLGAGWLFVLVKLLVASALVVLLTDYVREDPGEGYLLLGFMAAVGLGPGVHNLLLFAVTTGSA